MPKRYPNGEMIHRRSGESEVFVIKTVVICFVGCSSLAVSVFGQGRARLLPPNHINPRVLSQGARMWWFGPQTTTASPAGRAAITPTWPNVDAANPNEDV